MVICTGNNKAISTSQIMKINAIRKNRDENGSRAEFLWVKPTFEWGSFFSVFVIYFFRLVLLML